MPKYQTKQRRLLLDFLSAHPDEMLSAKQISDALAPFGISMSAVYRNIAELEEEGKLKRLSSSERRDVLYQYIGSEACKRCLHLTCKKCGKTMHMNPLCAKNLISRVATSDHFDIDIGETVLYGVCDKCKAK